MRLVTECNNFWLVMNWLSDFRFLFKFQNSALNIKELFFLYFIKTLDLKHEHETFTPSIYPVFESEIGLKSHTNTKHLNFPRKCCGKIWNLHWICLECFHNIRTKSHVEVILPLKIRHRGLSIFIFQRIKVGQSENILTTDSI